MDVYDMYTELKVSIKMLIISICYYVTLTSIGDYDMYSVVKVSIQM